MSLTILMKFGTPIISKISKQFIDGERPETCSRCFREEDAGVRPVLATTKSGGRMTYR